MTEITLEVEYSKYANDGERRKKIFRACKELDLWVHKDDENSNDLRINCTIKGGKITIRAVKSGKYKERIIL
jgi:hypothetical protein